MAGSRSFGWRGLILLTVLGGVVVFSVRIPSPADALPIDDPIRDVGDRTRDLADGVREGARDVLNDVRDAGREAVDRGEEAARDAFRAGGGAGGSVGGAVKGSLAQAAEAAPKVQEPSDDRQSEGAATPSSRAEAQGSPNGEAIAAALGQSSGDGQNDLDEVAEGGNRIEDGTSRNGDAEPPPCDGFGLCLGILFGAVAPEPEPQGSPPLSFTGLNILLAMLISSILALMGTGLLATSSDVVPLPISSSGPGALRIHLLRKAHLPNWPAPR